MPQTNRKNLQVSEMHLSLSLRTLDVEVINTTGTETVSTMLKVQRSSYIYIYDILLPRNVKFMKQKHNGLNGPVYRNIDKL